MELTDPKPAAKRCTLAEYFKLAAASETKLEYRDGEIIDMAAAKFERDRIWTGIGAVAPVTRRPAQSFGFRDQRLRPRRPFS